MSHATALATPDLAAPPVARDEVRPGIEVTPEGFVRVWVRVATSGRMAYPEHGFVAWVPVETLTDPESLASLLGKPVFIEHPAGEITPNLVASSAIGTVLEVEARNGEPYARMQIDRPEGIRYGQTREWAVNVSPGYGYRANEGQHGADITQADRRYDHVALTDTPRGGPRVRSILTATDSHPNPGADRMLDPSNIAERMIAAGVDPDTAAILAAEIVEMLPTPEPEDDASVDEMVEDASDEADVVSTDSDAVDALKRQVDAMQKRIRALTDERDSLRLSTCRNAILTAAKDAGKKVGDSPDLLKVAEVVCASQGVARKGMDAATFLRDSLRFAAPASAAKPDIVKARDTAGNPNTSHQMEF